MASLTRVTIGSAWGSVGVLLYLQVLGLFLFESFLALLGELGHPANYPFLLVWFAIVVRMQGVVTAQVRARWKEESIGLSLLRGWTFGEGIKAGFCLALFALGLILYRGGLPLEAVRPAWWQLGLFYGFTWGVSLGFHRWVDGYLAKRGIEPPHERGAELIASGGDAAGIGLVGLLFTFIGVVAETHALTCFGLVALLFPLERWLLPGPLEPAEPGAVRDSLSGW